MECAKSKELLSDFMDDILDGQTRALVEEHLLKCKDCREDLASLKALVQEIGSLESLNAPKDFLEKVHERIEQRSKFGQIMRKLFVPVRIKVPLELATVAATAILVLAVLNIQQPRKQIAEIPPGSDRLMSAGKAKVNTVKSMVKKEAYKPTPPREKATAGLPDKQGEVIELALLIKAEASSRAYAPPPASHTPPEAKTRGLEQEEPAATFPAREWDALTDEAASSFSYLDDALSKVKDLVGRVGGEVISIEYEMRTERPKSIHAEVPVKDYKSFCEGLKRIGLLQTSPPSISEKDQTVIRTRIRLIPSN
jgi:hypothetical protein